MSGSTVALVLVPGRERDLQSLPSGTPVWVASVEAMKSTLAAANASGLLVTELIPNGEGPLQWIHNHLDSLDQHHNEFSGDVPGPYRRLLVFGLAPSTDLDALLGVFGFAPASPEPYGFSAVKQLPAAVQDPKP